MVRLDIKPMSVNKCWLGVKRPTDEFKAYRELVSNSLPEEYEVPDDGELAVVFIWGLSNRANDVDNSCKPFLDCLQTKYGFDDKRVYEIYMQKVIVPKGKEYIEFGIYPREDVEYQVWDVDTGDQII